MKKRKKDKAKNYCPSTFHRKFKKTGGSGKLPQAKVRIDSSSTKFCPPFQLTGGISVQSSITEHRGMPPESTHACATCYKQRLGSLGEADLRLVSGVTANKKQRSCGGGSGVPCGCGCDVPCGGSGPGVDVGAAKDPLAGAKGIEAIASIPIVASAVGIEAVCQLEGDLMIQEERISQYEEEVAALRSRTRVLEAELLKEKRELAQAKKVANTLKGAAFMAGLQKRSAVHAHKQLQSRLPKLGKNGQVNKKDAEWKEGSSAGGFYTRSSRAAKQRDCNILLGW